MDDGVSFGNFGRNGVVVGNDGVDVCLVGAGDLAFASDAAIDSDDEADFFGNEFVDEFVGEAVAVGDAVGEAERDLGAELFECFVK